MLRAAVSALDSFCYHHPAMNDEQPIEQEHNDGRPGDEQDGGEERVDPSRDEPPEGELPHHVSRQEHQAREAAGELGSDAESEADAAELDPFGDSLGAEPQEAETLNEDLLSQDLLGEDLLSQDLLSEEADSADAATKDVGRDEPSETANVVPPVDMEAERAAEAAQRLDIEERAPELFRGYLDTLVADTRGILAAISRDDIPKQVRLRLIAGANYLFKSLDLIDEGVLGLGFLDDAFILRFCCSRARSLGALPEDLLVLAREAAAIRAFLGDLSPRFETFVKSLDEMVVRGRSPQMILDDGALRDELIAELEDWAQRHKTPTFVFDAHGLVKLRSFLNAKLPR